MLILLRRMITGAALLVLAGCATQAKIDEPQVAMGDFRLGHNIVVVSEPAIGPFSRTIEDEELKNALTLALTHRLGGYEGEKFYNIGAKIDAYALAMPGVPIVFTPKSVLVVTVTLWDDESGTKLNEEEKVFTVFEGLSEKTLLGSGLTQNKVKQLENLANNAARSIQKWILQNPEWIGLPPLPEEVPTVETSTN
ncbi:MAG: hypothetical protein KUG69_05930 [Marinosulfonomonas sp.]|nr:hypothetical protein [Marinosulfonomonas sp.]